MKFKAFVNGEFISAVNPLEIMSPWNNLIIGEVPALSKTEINFAFESAKEAYKTYKYFPLDAKKEKLIKLANLLLEHKHQIAEIMLKEIAKDLTDSILEVERSALYIEKTIEAWDKIKDEQIRINNKVANISRVPLGVVLAISPFNYPVNLAIAKIVPALLSGNTVVFKPATNGSLVGCFIAELINQCEFPKGVFNVVTGKGREIGDVLVTNKNISMISFTGSVDIGKNIAKLNPMIPLVLELGGNDAAYVRADADLELAAKEIASGAFGFAGQRCTAIKRLIIHKDIYENFKKLLLIEVKKIKNNPLISAASAQFVQSLINDAKASNDEFILESENDHNMIGFNIIKTTTSSKVWQEEAFGPVLPIVIIENEKDLINIFNDSKYGLQNSLFTTNKKWALEFATNLECGTVNINRSSSRGPDDFPFLGVKDSGFGVQGIKEALLSMTRPFNVVEND